MDFVTDQLADGQYFRVFSVVDQLSRECVALHAAISIRSKDVGEVLDDAIQRRSAPAAITCDNGTEFTSRHFDAWAYFRKIDLDFIRPGKPVENAFIESFNGRFRDECLSQTWFTDIEDARSAIAAWAKDYNESRPHTALWGLAPREYVPQLLAEEALEEAILTEDSSQHLVQRRGQSQVKRPSLLPFPPKHPIDQGFTRNPSVRWASLPLDRLRQALCLRVEVPRKEGFCPGRGRESGILASNPALEGS